MVITTEEFARVAHNFYMVNNLPGDVNRIGMDIHLYNYLNGNLGKLKKFRIAFCWICLGQPYWQYAQPMIDGARQFFLPGHEVDYFLWSDMPAQKSPLRKKEGKNAYTDGFNDAIEQTSQMALGATLFPTEWQPWPAPTLMRYHLFLQQEELLKDYDYVFYCDVDMRFVNFVGDEILGTGLTAAPHPGYYLKKELWPPYEPNKDSASYISRPGKVILDEGKRRFMPMYFAGGFQGGTSKEWFKAMHAMKKKVDEDMAKGYVPIWNDETVWNKYLEKTPEDLIFLDPGYIYPDSLIEEYYVKFWGRNFIPRLVTLTKPFTTSAEGGAAVKKLIV